MEATVSKKQVFVPNADYSFLKGWNQVKQQDVIKVKLAIYEIFGITSDAAWRRRLKGAVTPNMEQMKAVEAVFKSFKIKGVWGF